MVFIGKKYTTKQEYHYGVLGIVLRELSLFPYLLPFVLFLPLYTKFKNEHAAETFNIALCLNLHKFTFMKER